MPHFWFGKRKSDKYGDGKKCFREPDTGNCIREGDFSITKLNCENMGTKLEEKDIFIKDINARIICEAMNRSDSLLFTGDVGTGKTVTAETMGSIIGMDTIVIPPTGGDEIEEVVGEWNIAKQILNIELAKEVPQLREEAIDVFSENNFIVGPLLNAMLSGKVLVIDEINRFDESVQNKLLEVADRHEITLPNIGKIEARPGFNIIATANDADLGINPLSTALLRRFVRVPFNLPDSETMEKIIKRKTNSKQKLIDDVVKLYQMVKSNSSSYQLPVPSPAEMVRYVDYLSLMGIDNLFEKEEDGNVYLNKDLLYDTISLITKTKEEEVALKSFFYSKAGHLHLGTVEEREEEGQGQEDTPLFHDED